MKKLICLLVQVISLTMWFIFIVDKEKINIIFNSTELPNETIQVMFMIVATIMLAIAIIGFMIPEKSPKNLNKKHMVEE